jgi:hypothetical protein
MDLILDIFDLVNLRGVIPPLAVLNQVLQSGSSGGGMSAETAWRPFAITEAECAALVTALTQVDLATEKQKHPYVASVDRLIIDPELDDCVDHIDWMRRVVEKYPRK